jgi:hypothetical protein
MVANLGELMDEAHSGQKMSPEVVRSESMGVLRLNDLLRPISASDNLLVYEAGFASTKALGKGKGR